jgi:hypothetical protein
VSAERSPVELPSEASVSRPRGAVDCEDVGYRQVA